MPFILLFITKVFTWLKGTRHLKPFVEKMEKGVVNAEVEVMESVGGESYLYLTCSGHSITAGVDADAMRQSGEPIQIAFDMEKIKLFDSDTEHTIWR